MQATLSEGNGGNGGNGGSFAKNLCADRLHANKPPVLQGYHAVTTAISQSDPDPSSEIQLMLARMPPLLSRDISGLYRCGFTVEEKLINTASYLAHLHREANSPSVAIAALQGFALESIEGKLLANDKSNQLRRTIRNLCEKVNALHRENAEKDHMIRTYQDLKDGWTTSEALIEDNAQKALELQEANKRIKILNNEIQEADERIKTLSNVKGMMNTRMKALEGHLDKAMDRLRGVGIQASEIFGSGWDESDEEESSGEEA